MKITDPRPFQGTERRRFPRASRTFLVVCKDLTGTVATIPHFVYAYGKNISKGGIFFESVEKFPVHSRLEFSLYASTLPEAIKVQGEVVWTKPSQENGLYYYGVNFCEISPHDMLLIEQLVGTQIDHSMSH
jgi:Tfp pilus assembly protein PilZ